MKRSPWKKTLKFQDIKGVADQCHHLLDCGFPGVWASKRLNKATGHALLDHAQGLLSNKTAWDELPRYVMPASEKGVAAMRGNLLAIRNILLEPAGEVRDSQIGPDSVEILEMYAHGGIPKATLKKNLREALRPNRRGAKQAAPEEQH